MRNPVPTPVTRPLERCQTQACVESRREVDTIVLWGLVVSLLALGVLALVARAWMRAQARAAARKQQAIHDRAQDELEQLFGAPAPEDGKTRQRGRTMRT